MFRGRSGERLSRLARRALAVGMLASVVMLVWSLVISPLRTEISTKNAEIITKREHLARYVHVAQLEKQVSEIGERANALGGEAEAFIAGSEAIAGAQLQARLKSFAGSNRVTFRSARSLPVRKGNDATTIGVRVHVSGALGDIQKLTYMIERSTPFMFVNAAQITAGRTQPRQGSKPVIPLEVQLDVYGVFRPDETP